MKATTLIRVIAQAATISALLFPSASKSAQITTESEIDLSKGYLWSNALFGVFDFPSSITVAAGDSVDMTVRFASSQRAFIQEGGSQFLTGWLYPDFEKSTPGASNFTILNVSLAFLNERGGVIREFTSASQSDGNGHLGPLYWDFYLAPGEVLTFSGYRARYDVSYIEESPYVYSGVFLQFASINGGLVGYDVSPVPEPATAGLLALGLAVVGAAGRRR